MVHPPLRGFNGLSPSSAFLNATCLSVARASICSENLSALISLTPKLAEESDTNTCYDWKPSDESEDLTDSHLTNFVLCSGLWDCEDCAGGCVQARDVGFTQPFALLRKRGLTVRPWFLFLAVAVSSACVTHVVRHYLADRAMQAEIDEAQRPIRELTAKHDRERAEFKAQVEAENKVISDRHQAALQPVMDMLTLAQKLYDHDAVLYGKEEAQRRHQAGIYIEAAQQTMRQESQRP